MKFLRSHIARLTVALFVGLGFSLYMVQPAQAEYTSDAFTSWLSSMTKVSGADQSELQKELQDLRHSDKHLNKVIEKASEIVVQNNKKFAFPFAETNTDAVRQVYQLLLVEWNQHQTGNAMTGLPVQQSVKSLAPLKIDNLQSTASTIACPRNPSDLSLTYLEEFENQVENSVAVIPMDECIAIGAP